MSQIWEIIPKITSPLAVICFGFYVFYLLKRSEDRRKEKSLLVADQEAQKNAVNKISGILDTHLPQYVPKISTPMFWKSP